MQDLVLEGSNAVAHSRGQLHRVRRPEGGAEREMVFRLIYHRCPGSAWKGRSAGDPDIDLILFPIGLAGADMPVNIPFEVPAAHACGACGKLLRIWAEWEAPEFIFL